VKQVHSKLATWKLVFASLKTEGSQDRSYEFNTDRLLITTTYVYDTVHVINTVTIVWHTYDLGFDKIEPALLEVRASISRMMLDEGSTCGPMVGDMNATIIVTGTQAYMSVQ
jgi:hypothetical protein